MDKLIENLRQIAEERFTQPDLEDCFIVDILVNGKKIEVYMDSDEGVRFAQCQKLSRALEAYLDESQILGEKYTLDVSSPGVDRPLKFKRQYYKHLGRRIRVKLVGDTILEGELTGVEDEKIEVTTPGKKKEPEQVHEIDFNDIKESKILITFSK